MALGECSLFGRARKGFQFQSCLRFSVLHSSISLPTETPEFLCSTVLIEIKISLFQLFLDQLRDEHS